MTIMDYLVVGIVVAALIRGHRRFLGWHISLSPQGNRMAGAAGLNRSTLGGQNGHDYR
ncbi:MAG TPA: hypothetical protein VFA51_02070 [Candidatus Udaeobacter sp.]|nr:hypothetical protein [Candidatus Udaeobacter sp.]